VGLKPIHHFVCCLTLVVGSAASFATDAGTSDAGATDAGAADAGTADAGQADAGRQVDGGVANDAGAPSPDAGVPADAGVDAGAPPPEPVWTCDPAFYDNNDGCDCECGIPDPDCSLPNPADPSVYGCPENTQCSDIGYCELDGCGNGVVDGEFEACDDGNNDPYDGCSPSCQQEAGWSCVADPTTCVPVPAGWGSNIGPFCSDSRYLDGAFCDCGCGVLDPDCAALDAECNGLPLGCIPEEAVNIDGELDMGVLTHVPSTTDNTQCVENVCGDTWTAGAEECDDGNTVDGDTCDASCVIEHPPEWTCAPQFYLDDQCDCGCGASDPACPGDALDPAADCDFDECRGPEYVDTEQHGLCLPRDDAFDPNPTVDAGITDEPDPEPADDDDGCSATTVTSSAAPMASLLLSFFLLPLVRRRRSVR